METNLARLAEATLDRLGDHPTLWFDGAWYSSAGLHERATRLATGLREMGIGPGDRVLVLMANCAEVTVLYHAIWRAGAVVTPVVFLVTGFELSHIIDDSAAVAVFTSPELAPKVAEAVGERAVSVVVVAGDFGELEQGPAKSIVDRRADDLAALLYTGGTTGRSKGVPLTHANLSHAGAASRAVSHVPGLTRGISALPLSHSYGLLVTVGGLHVPEPTSSVLQRWFEPADWLRLAERLRAQVAAVVPSMLSMLLTLPWEEHDLSALRFVFSGAAPLSPAIAEEFRRRVPSAQVIEGYGCTETGGIISSTPPMAPRPGTVGTAVPNVDIRIVRADGEDAVTGEDGEIVVRGPNVMANYWQGEPLRDGWFHTGDVGRLDPDGYLTIVDRIKDVIIRGGYNVYPRDVEDVLQQHPAVAMSAVIGKPDPRLGEEVLAFVALTGATEVTGEDLVAFARQRLAANKYPREVRIVPAIPLTSVGKLDRKRLRATAADQAGASLAGPGAGGGADTGAAAADSTAAGAG
jgi:long-chain acyl-CoA synthetase